MNRKENYRYRPKYHSLEALLWNQSFLKKRSKELSILSIDRYYGRREIEAKKKHEFWEMGCIVRGSIEFVCDDNSRLNSDTVFMIPPNVPHYEFCTIPADIIWISLCGDLFNEKISQTYTSVNNYELACMIEKLWIFTEIKEAGIGPEIDAKIMEIVSRFFRILQFGSVRQLSDMTEKAITYLNTHMSKQISMPDVAEEMGCSQTYFRRLFKMRTGRTPLEYLQGLRLQHGKSLLEHTNMTIAEIASTVGYDDAFYFSRVFKKAYGISPSYFRESIQNVND